VTLSYIKSLYNIAVLAVIKITDKNSGNEHPHRTGWNSLHPWGSERYIPPSYINLHDSMPQGFEAEVFMGQMPLLSPNQW